MTPRTRPVDLPEGYRWHARHANDVYHLKDYIILTLHQISEDGSRSYPVDAIEVPFYASIRRRSKKLRRRYFKQKDRLVEEINR